MSESKQELPPKQPETKPKKMVRRNVALALGVICIVLVAGLAGTIMVLNSQITSLQDQLDFWTNIVNLNESSVMENITITNSYSGAWYLQYSGLVWVDLQTNSTSFVVTGGFREYGDRISIVQQETRNYSQYTSNKYFPFISVKGSQLPLNPNNFGIQIYDNSAEVLTGNLTIIYYY
jgi:hypothetical protein